MNPQLQVYKAPGAPRWARWGLALLVGLSLALTVNNWIDRDVRGVIASGLLYALAVGALIYIEQENRRHS